MFLELENQKLKKLYNLKLLVITKSEISSCESCEVMNNLNNSRSETNTEYENKNINKSDN